MANPTLNNYSVKEQVALYKTLTEKLITEKQGITEEKLKQKEEKNYQLAKTKGILSIIGDDQFKAKIDAHLRKIASVRPGRKLIKLLAKTQRTVNVQQGPFGFAASTMAPNDPAFIAVDDCESVMLNALDENGDRCVVQAPAWICFAHELIHAQHYYTNFSACYKYRYTKQDMLPYMGDIEEQITITGFNPFLFAILNTLKPEDMISENAFYLAVGLPVRIDHRAGDTNGTLTDISHSYDSYYAWIEKEVTSMGKIPEDKKSDLKFLSNSLINYTQAARIIYDEHKDDHDFMIKLYCYMDKTKKAKMLSFFPQLRKDSVFIIKLMDFVGKSKAVEILSACDPELRKSKEFVLQALDKMGPLSKDLAKMTLMMTIDRSLQKDPDIRKKLGL